LAHLSSLKSEFAKWLGLLEKLKHLVIGIEIGKLFQKNIIMKINLKFFQILLIVPEIILKLSDVFRSSAMFG